MTIRLGDIQFLNSWPVTYALRQGIVKSDPPITLVSGTPAELNRRLLTGELDASAVSSALFLRHQEELVPVPGLCIRCDGGIQSVLVVSRRPLITLRGQTIGITNQAATTPILLQLLLANQHLKFSFEVTSLRYPEILKEYPAALLIGDEALLAAQEDGHFVWDLGQAWSSWTRLPFVFALWVIRRAVLEREPSLLTRITQTLHFSYEWSTSHPKELISAMRKVFPWEVTFLIRYLAAVSYDLDEKAWRGLRRFALEAERKRLLPKGSARGLRERESVFAMMEEKR